MDQPSSSSAQRKEGAFPPTQAAAEGGVASATTSFLSELFLKNKQVSDAVALVADLCRQFYTLGWVSGTGGAMSLKFDYGYNPNGVQLIVMSPSGVQKERMAAEDMFVLSSDGYILSTPPLQIYSQIPSTPKITDCSTLFLKIYEMRNAGAIIHSHGLEACLITIIKPYLKDFRISHLEMIKGIDGHGYDDELVVPIIENAPREGELINSIAEAITNYPKTSAVLVRNHGVFIWGKTWISAKTQAECYHYLFDAAIKLHQLGLGWSTPILKKLDKKISEPTNHLMKNISENQKEVKPIKVIKNLKNHKGEKKIGRR